MDVSCDSLVGWSDSAVSLVSLHQLEIDIIRVSSWAADGIAVLVTAATAVS